MNPIWLEPGGGNNIRTSMIDYYKGFTGTTQPIVGISWDDARAYVAWLSNQTGIAFLNPHRLELLP